MRSKMEMFRSPVTRILKNFPPNRPHLIGVSGGRDSIVLLHWLTSLGYRKLIVCHLDHELRGRASQADARFVASMAAKLELDCEIGRTDVRALAAQSKLSIETAARGARFAFFVRVARQKRCRTIFLGHHADDLVETALLNLFRGASPGGVAAMRGVSLHRIGKTELTIVRPLLGIWRREIDLYIRQNDLTFREDATNTELGSTRNRIRHRVLPHIEKQLGRDVRKAIWRVTQIWIGEEDLLESLVSDRISASELDVVSMRKMPVALQRRAIVDWLRARGITNIGFETVDSIRNLLDPECKGAKVNLPRGRYARRRAKKIFIE
ncbi:MAG: tRNA lysidine(34) synthetase TilS [Verrucomicrobia bacterium]|nr:MAG: tRNA lysidine(34) synthetase TilS [Verrucomicrobiota bacterium]